MFLFTNVNELVIQLIVSLENLGIIGQVLLIEMHQPMKAVCNIDVLEHSFEEEVFQIRLFQVFVSERLDQLQHY